MLGVQNDFFSFQINLKSSELPSFKTEHQPPLQLNDFVLGANERGVFLVRDPHAGPCTFFCNHGAPGIQ